MYLNRVFQVRRQISIIRSIAQSPPQTCLFEQFYRRCAPLVSKLLLEFPAGHVDDGENPLDAARRELEEETGHKARKVEQIYSYHPAMSRTSQAVHVFGATGLSRASATRHDDGEQISLKKITVKQLSQLIAKGKVQSASTLIAFLLCCIMKINPGNPRY